MSLSEVGTLRAYVDFNPARLFDPHGTALAPVARLTALLRYLLSEHLSDLGLVPTFDTAGGRARFLPPVDPMSLVVVHGLHIARDCRAGRLHALDAQGVAVGLTAPVELSLSDAGLIDFFDKHRAAFKEIASRAYSFAHDNVQDTGLPLRKDDVATSLAIGLVTNESLRDYLATKKLRQKHWYDRFADLIIDRLWEELADEYAKQSG